MKTQIQEYKDSHPIARSFHTGKWGFRRYLDGVDLRRCTYGSKKAAEMARAQAAEEHASLRLSLPSQE